MNEKNIQQLTQSVKSIAIVGANYRFATQVMLNNLEKFNFKGEIYLVNPKYEEINGKKCFPSLIDIPVSIDVVVGVVNPQLMVKVAKEASNISAKILVMPGGGYGESGAEGKKIQDSILESALKTGMRIVGPNCMGYADLNRDFTPYIGTLDRPNRPLRKGSVSIVSQSGSILDSFIASNLKLNKLFSTGNEIDI